MRLAWTGPDANGLAIDAYEILVLESDGVTWTTVLDTCDGSDADIVSATACDVPIAALRAAPFALVLNDPVLAKVRAHNLLGWSAAYSPPTVAGGTIKTEPAAPPTAPTEGAATDDTQVQVEWAALTGDDAGQEPITLYAVYWDAGGTTWPLLVLQSAGSFTFSFTQSAGVEPGGAYRFRYRATNQHGTGDWSPIATVYATATPLAPAAASTANNGLDVDVTWPAVTSDRGAVVSAYSVKFRQADGTYTAIVPACDGSLSGIVAVRACSVPVATLTNAPFSLQVGDLIAVQVEAYNAKGWSGPSPANTAGALAQTAPTAGATASRGDATSATQLEVTWAAISASPADGGSAILSYEVYWDEASGDAPTAGTWTLVATVGAASPTLSVTAGPGGITTGATYQFAVLGVNQHGSGPLGAILAVLAAGEPAAPTGVTAGSATSTSLTFTWTAPTDTGGVPLTDYQIYWNQGNPSPAGTSLIYVPLATTGSTAATYTATGLGASRSYGFRVAAINSAGTGDPSPPTTLSTTA